ncbi:MAG: 1-acyl-sn-glycerol-3-phosphate acyltransferase [Desulfobacterota bacterium]|nr:1-acyl-sn-glycerol-3-phosphate acyltransferase [Thermodesulfobacteriota bacterium]
MKSSEKEILYPYALDDKPRFLLGWVLSALFRRARVDESAKEGLTQLQKEGTVVYATKYRGHLDYLLYHYNLRRRHLPYPKIAFDLNMALLLPVTRFFKVLFSYLSFFYRSGKFPSPYQTSFYGTAMQEGTPSLIFLIDPKRFISRFIHAEKDHLQFLLETQKTLDRPIFIVPQLILYETSAEKDYETFTDILFGYRDYPSVIRKILMFVKHRGEAIIDFAQPLDLKAYLQSQPAERPLHEMVSEIRDALIESIDSRKRVILGPIMKSRQQLKEMVLMDPRVSEKIESTAASEKKSLSYARKKAGEYFDEIAADFNITYVHLFDIGLKWLWKKAFEGIDVDSSVLGMVKEWARKGPLIFIPSHKSHIDYLILNYVLHESNMHIPRVAAGKNLAFWPIGYIFRKAGAFFIRRSFRQPRLYLEVFNRYIKALLEEGHPIEVYIEGGRSRNGKLVLPKTGFLSILLQAHAEGFCKDLVFVPTSIVYDRIMEEQSYRKEIEGGEKEQEKLRHILGARRLLKRKYGKVYIRFNPPVSLNEYIQQTNPAQHELPRRFAFKLVKAINDVTPVTPLTLVATAILGAHRRGFLYTEILETVETLIHFLKAYSVPMAASLADPNRATQETLSLLLNWKIVEVLEDVDQEEETFYFVEDERKIELEYYKNNIIHFFLPHALVATSLLTGRDAEKKLDAMVSDYIFMKNLLKAEFLFDEEENEEDRVRSILDYFLQSSFVSASMDQSAFIITKMGYDRLPVWASLTKTFMESYWIAAKAMSHPKNHALKEEALLKKMSYLGKRFHKLGVVDHVGALSKLNFTNAVAVIKRDFIKRRPDKEQEPAEVLSLLSQRIYELSRHGQ